jgi:hypothetical protein
MTGNVLTTPEGFINAALGRIGYKRRIGSVWEGSEAAKHALDIYGQTRDALLRVKDWDFAQKNVALTVAGITPPSPWSLAYLYPSDCIRIRDLFGPAYLADTNDPLPNPYQRAVVLIAAALTDVILTNVAGAQLVYTGRITNPSLWEPGFGEALIEGLGRRLAPVLATLDAEKAQEQAEVATITAMADIQG